MQFSLFHSQKNKQRQVDVRQQIKQV